MRKWCPGAESNIFAKPLIPMGKWMDWGWGTVKNTALYSNATSEIALAGFKRGYAKLITRRQLAARLHSRHSPCGGRRHLACCRESDARSSAHPGSATTPPPLSRGAPRDARLPGAAEGMRCVPRIFVFSAGTVQTASSRSDPCHSAVLNSPARGKKTARIRSTD